jgi:hypothetical protein
LAFTGGVFDRLPLDLVESIRLMTAPVVFLSDLQPKSAVEKSIMTPSFKWKRDKNAVGKILMMDGEPVEKGIGVHAESTLTFSIPADATKCVGTVGLDPMRGQKGDCVSRILVDDEVMFEKRLNSGASLHDFSLVLGDSKTITLQVAAGEMLDLGDHVNWYQIRFLKD